MKTKTVLISGASVAGPALAFWLTRYGFKVTIVERAPAIRPGGYAVDFRGTAIHVLKRMGLYEEVKKHETRAGKITLVDKQGKKIAGFPDGFTSGELEIMRGDLANILYEASREHVEYIFDDSIIGLRECEDGVNVTFDHHQPRKFDLVFGADGLHSKVRALAFGNESNYIHHLGLYIAIFTTPQFIDLGMDGLYYGVPGKRMGVFGARNGKEARASFYFASEAFAYNYRDTEQQKQIITARFSGEEWHTEQLLKLMDTAPDFYFDSISQIKMDSWSKGRIALVGDAAHCASPMSGMGTSMALIGAYILAGELKAADGDYQQAFASYETQMRTFVQKCQELADGVEWFVPKTKFRQWMSRQLWRLLPYTPWKNMMIELPQKIANSITVREYYPG
ncbi:FAD-dependent monooxygenase [Chitinophaga sp. S165]|uniref:FAD-dependent monooxygenase n=1 Tax=Chitinophaga sp. S165 TaxID=2135462 RepID=UPI000D715911|nr:FAD-dependent monooxygenase [Chitinophaga sp. S165]PWV55620.1 2-polyprenyl-6-methoxyphenol hydroxylase-like FAD-dependent oxidoreductase [Chitinophaga sp. S165]